MFREAETLLKSYGCTVKNRTGGSHYSVSHPQIDEVIILPKHNVPLKKYNIRDIKDFINEIPDED